VEQIEALLAHELAHVRRYDYFVNLLQTAMETLFFYHPGVWWVSRQIRKERENCCDDLAIEVCGSTLLYVQALTELEQIRVPTPRLAMAADGGSLLKRVERLLGNHPASGATPSGWVATIALVACLITAVVAIRAAARPMQPVRPHGGGTFVPPQPPAVFPQQVPTLLAQQTPAPARPSEAEPVKPQTQQQEKSGGDWLDGIRAEGYRDLSVDQMIALKIHGVDAAYVREIRAAVGATLTADQLVAFRIHEVTPDWVNGLKQAGLGDLAPDKLIALKIHGADGAYMREMRAAGATLTAEQLVTFRIHQVTADWVNGLKQTGLGDLTPDKLIALKIHGADGAWVRGIQSLGYPNLSSEMAVTLRIHQITPEFIREAHSKFKDLTLEQVIQLKLMGILKTPTII
jgi:hypothetical protein